MKPKASDPSDLVAWTECRRLSYDANGNRIYAKLEFQNPTGSHYDRVYPPLLRHLEETGRIRPDTHHLIEVTSGNAGIAFAHVCRQLGYRATVIMPESVPPVRGEIITSAGSRIVKTPAHLYIRGCVAKLREMLRERPPEPNMQYCCPDHSRNPVAPAALESVAAEALDQIDGPVDYFIAAVGNGISILGPGRLLKLRCRSRVIAWDPIEAPVAFELSTPGRYARSFGIVPGTLGPHDVFGTGVLGVHFPMLHTAALGVTEKGTSPVIDETTLVVSNGALAELGRLADRGQAKRHAERLARRLPSLSRAMKHLREVEGINAGRSSAGSLAVAMDLCDRVRNKSVLVIFYDDVSKY